MPCIECDAAEGRRNGRIEVARHLTIDRLSGFETILRAASGFEFNFKYQDLKMQKNELDVGTSVYRSATDWLFSLKSREIGAVELLDLHVDQLNRHDDKINAIVVRDLDAAYAAARSADNAAPTDDRPLLGLPMTIKECFGIEGLPTTCGLPFFADNKATCDAETAARLKRAGAIIYGKSNLPPGAFDWQSDNPIYGRTANPWDVTRTPGGSSGGSAAAVAAGFTPLELGSDIGGSIRVPAHCCGVYGHKPSWGTISLQGHVPPAPGQDLPLDLGVAGPLARSAVDLELAMDILVGPENRFAPFWSAAMPPARRESLAAFRVAVWLDDEAYGADHRCLAAIEEWVEDLGRLGVKVERTRPRIDWAESFEIYLLTLFQLLAASQPPEAMTESLRAAAALSPEDKSYPAYVLRAMQMRHYEYVHLTDRRRALMRSWAELFAGYDLLICPAFPTVAYPHDARGNDNPNTIEAYEQREMIVNGVARPYMDNIQWPSVATVADLPATAVPTGRFVDGMPVGVQIIGPALEDRTPIRFASLVEREIGGFKVPNGF